MSSITKLKEDLIKIKQTPELKKSIIYLIATVFSYGIVFIQNFSLAYFLPIPLFGEVSLIISLFSTFYVLYTFGLNAVVLRFHFDKKYHNDRPKLISNILSIWFIMGIILTAILLVMGYMILVVFPHWQLDYFNKYIYM